MVSGLIRLRVEVGSSVEAVEINAACIVMVRPHGETKSFIVLSTGRELTCHESQAEVCARMVGVR